MGLTPLSCVSLSVFLSSFFSFSDCLGFLVDKITFGRLNMPLRKNHWSEHSLSTWEDPSNLYPGQEGQENIRKEKPCWLEFPGHPPFTLRKESFCGGEDQPNPGAPRAEALCHSCCTPWILLTHISLPWYLCEIQPG